MYLAAEYKHYSCHGLEFNDVTRIQRDSVGELAALVSVQVTVRCQCGAVQPTLDWSTHS